MTIVAGFKTSEGVVLCADTQESIGGISKRNVPKLRFEPSDSYYRVSAVLAGRDPDGVEELAVAFCGATDNGPYVDMLIDEAWRAASVATSLSEACDLIKHSIKETYREYGGIYQPGHLPTAELIYGVKMEGRSRLFYAFGPAITESDRYVCGGVGGYMADFVASRMYDQYLSVRQCIILAAYILFQAKEHVDGCGGDSHIAVLRDEGTCGLVSADNVETATKLVVLSDKTIGELLISYADMGLTKEEFTKKAGEALEQLATVRDFEIEKFRDNKEMWKAFFGTDLHDDIGLPSPAAIKPSGAQKSGDQQ